MNKPLFQQIYLEITNICNLHCPFCSKTNRKNAFMSLSDLSNYIDKIKPYTHSIYLHVKGEPLLHPYFRDIIALLEEKHVNTKLTTNGTKILDYQEIILNNPIIPKINISLQAISSMKDGEIDLYFNNLKTFIDSNKTTYIYLRNWASSDNETNIIKKYLNQWYPNVSLKDGVKLSSHVIYSEASKFVWPKDNEEECTASPCLGGKNQLGVLVDGTVTLCCLDDDGLTNLGNLKDKSLEDILNSEKYKKAVKEMPYLDICKKCSYRLKFIREEMKQS